jgi:quercetin dioxygenase-like cupin family protein
MIQYGAMDVFNWDRLEEEQLNPLLSRKAIHTAGMTVARIRLRKYAVVPAHAHANAQLTMLQSGSLRFVLDGKEVVLRAGDMLDIPPHASHSVEALEDSVAVDVFAPPREDWQRGDDAYLRALPGE